LVRRVSHTESTESWYPYYDLAVGSESDGTYNSDPKSEENFSVQYDML